MGVVAFFDIMLCRWETVFDILKERNGFVFVSKIQAGQDDCTRPVRKVSSHFEYLENRARDLYVRGGADKSLDRTRRKQATENKIESYYTYSPRTSIYFLARCSNFSSHS